VVTHAPAHIRHRPLRRRHPEGQHPHRM